MPKKIFFLLGLLLFLHKPVFSQCTISSTCGYSMDINMQIINIVPSSYSCPYGYNYNVKFSYSVKLYGVNTCYNGNIQLQPQFFCNSQNNGYYTINIAAPTVGAAAINTLYSGTLTTTSNPFTSNTDCNTVTPASANCNSMQISINGPGISSSNYPCTFSTLPIELLSFTAKANAGKVNLSWITATETNNNYFTVEKSPDAVSFEEVTQVKGAGNSLQELNYTATDNKPFLGLSYYRLKQTDNNGAFKYLPIVSVENNLNKIIISNIHPNPSAGYVDFDVYAPNKGSLRVQLIDGIGRIVFDNTQSMLESQSNIHLEISSLPKGLYTLKVSLSENGLSSVSKLIKD